MCQLVLGASNWDCQSLAPFRNAILTTVSTSFWLPSGLQGVTDPDEGGRVPLPHGARLRPSTLPSHKRRFCAFFHFFYFAPFFLALCRFSRLGKIGLPPFTIFQDLTHPGCKARQQILLRKDLTHLGHTVRPHVVHFPIDFASRFPPGTLGTCTPVQH